MHFGYNFKITKKIDVYENQNINFVDYNNVQYAIR